MLTFLPLLFVSGSLAATIHISVNVSVPLGDAVTAVHGPPQPLHSEDAQWFQGDKYSVVDQDVLAWLQFAPPKMPDTTVPLWLRQGMDVKSPVVVEGQTGTLEKDHLIELRWVRDGLKTYPSWETKASIYDLFIIMTVFNHPYNIFQISKTLNSKKSKIALAQFVTNKEMKDDYLCKGYKPVDPQFPKELVHERATRFLDSAKAFQNPVNDHIVDYLKTNLKLNTVKCP